jgi:hypothetical protein
MGGNSDQTNLTRVFHRRNSGVTMGVTTNRWSLVEVTDPKRPSTNGKSHGGKIVAWDYRESIKGTKNRSKLTEDGGSNAENNE